MKISILGSGWLGLALAQTLVNIGYVVKLSTRSKEKLKALSEVGARPYLIDIDALHYDVKDFLSAEILIVNITSKNSDDFRRLIDEIKQSTIKCVLFISSTSVYKAENLEVTESCGMESDESALYQIEQLFTSSNHFKTTVLRLAGLIGYSRHPGHFFKSGKVVQQADSPVNLIHRDDCIGIIQEIIRQDAWSEVFNGCASTHPTKREFYSYARNLLSMPPPDFSIDLKPSAYKQVSNTKVITRLSYQFIYPDLMTIDFQ